MSIWKKTEDDLYRLPAIGLDGIEKAEEELGVLLPTAYKELMLGQNGGTTIFNAYPSPVATSWGDYVKVEALMGVGKDSGILESWYFIEEWGMPKNLVLLYGDGHEWIALDYREATENPPVIFIDNEAEQIVELATDFDTFLKGLFCVDENFGDIEVDYELIPNYSKAQIKVELQTNDIGRLFDLVNMMSYSFDQKFVFEQYGKLLNHPIVEVRAQVAAQLYNIVTMDEVLYGDLLEGLVVCLVNDKNEHVNQYARLIREES